MALALGVGLASLTGGAAVAAAEPSPVTASSTSASDRGHTQEKIPLEITSPGRSYTIGAPIHIAGRATPGAFVLVDNPVVAGGVTVIPIDDSGTWTWTSDPVWKPSVTVTIKQKYDALGIDERLDVGFTGEEEEDDGTFVPLAITSERTYSPGKLLTVSGTATPDARIRFNDWSDPDGFWASGQAGADGRWTLTSSKPVRKDSVELTFLQSHDASGKSETVVETFTSDGSADPYVPIGLDTPRTYRIGDDVVLRGTATPGYRISVHNSDDETAVGADGQWTLPPFRATAEQYWFQVTQTLPDGSWSSSEWFTLSGQHTDVSFEQTTYALGETLNVSGYGTAGATLELRDGDEVIGATTVNDHGRWFLTTDDGIDTPRVNAVIRQTADHIGSTETRATFVADDVHVPIQVDGDGTYDPSQPVTLRGTATPNAHFRAYFGVRLERPIGAVRVNSHGQWQITTSGLLPIYTRIALEQEHYLGNERVELELDPFS